MSDTRPTAAPTKSSLNLNVRISGSLRDFVEHVTDAGDYETASEYVRDLIRRDKAAKEEAQFEGLKTRLQAAFAVPDEAMVETKADDIREMVQARRGE